MGVIEMRKLFTLLIVLWVLSPMIWAQTVSQPTVGDGSKENPYQISSAAELWWFANEVNENKRYDICAELTRDIDLNPGFTFDENGYRGSGWPTEWNSIRSYEGIFDGKGFEISGLYSNEGEALFSSIGNSDSNVIIRNIGISNSYIYGRSAAAFCDLSGQSAIISYCYTTHTVYIESTRNDAGGICVENEGLIKNCYNGACVLSLEASAGGICSTNRLMIEDCYNSGQIEGYRYAGGICFLNENSIANCYNIGTAVSSISLSGGIVGNNWGTISNCYNLGGVAISTNFSAGGICGLALESTIIENCYYLKNVANVGIAHDPGENENYTQSTDFAGIVKSMQNSGTFTSTNGWQSGATLNGDGINLPILGIGNEVSYMEDDDIMIPYYYLQIHSEKDEYGSVNIVDGWYQRGASVTAIATPKDGYHFFCWINDSKDTLSIDSNYTFTLKGNTFSLMILAVFEKDEPELDYDSDPKPEKPTYYTVTITSEEGGHTNFSGGRYEEGTELTIVAEPYNGYRFVKWKGFIDGEAVESPFAYLESVKVDGNITLTAIFERIEYNIWLEDVGGLSLTASASQVYYGDDVTITAYVLPDPNYTDNGLRLYYQCGDGGWKEATLEYQDGNMYQFVVYDVTSDVSLRWDGLEYNYPHTGTAIEDIEGTKVYAQNGSLYVYTPQPQEVAIITMNGTVLKREQQEGLRSYSLPKGVYIICIGEERMKVRL